MAKIELSKISIVNTENNEKVEYMSTKTPFKANVGHYFSEGLNHRGMTKFQQAGFPIHNEDLFNDLLIKTFEKIVVGLNKEDFGRTEKWSNEEGRAKFKVYINNEEYNPDFTTKQIAQQQISTNVEETPQEEILTNDGSVEVPQAMADITPIPTPTPQVIVPQPQTTIPAPQPQATERRIENSPNIPVAPKVEQEQLNTDETTMLNKLQGYLKSGEHSKDILKMSLVKKLGKERADIVWKIGTTQEVVF